MATKVGINGFGRIGRNVLRAALKHGSALEFVAVNDLTDPETLAHLLKYDSVHGTLGNKVAAGDKALLVDGKSMRVFSERDPESCPGRTSASTWCSSALACSPTGTGRPRICRGRQEGHHLGARQGGRHDPLLRGEPHRVRRGEAPRHLERFLHHELPGAGGQGSPREFGIRRGLMTTVHAYTNDQQILDLPHTDLRRARAAECR
jgi:glyceraldehyde 3-phosphate dehydrogenase